MNPKPVRRTAACIAAFAALVILAIGEPVTAEDRNAQDLADLSLEELASIVVTSVSRRAEPLGQAPASIYVITAEQIRRAGATTLQEALRLAPNLHVARADANQYAISARGFNSVLTNKLLVLLDGRTIYSPLFSGVFWEAQHIVLENVDRIEVISGPGGTLWGTNAVNGVINVITRSARETQGILLAGGAGTMLSTTIARLGWSMGSSIHVRLSGRYTDVAGTTRPNGSDVGDDAHRWIGRFRLDWGESTHAASLQTGTMRSDISQGAAADRILESHYALGQWQRRFQNGSGLRLHGYFDRSLRDQPGAIRERLDTWDVELHHELPGLRRHDVLWGGGFRHQSDRLVNLSPAVAFIPGDRDLEYVHLFAQDRIALHEDFDLIGGLKLERNLYTGWEYLPTVRMLWRHTDNRLLWGAWSRAVRAPSRIDRELFIPATPPFFALAGGPQFVSEIANVGEIGYRAYPTSTVSYSITGFLHEYDRLRSLEPLAAGPTFANGLEATLTGGEAWLTARLRPWWDVGAGFTEQRLRVRADAGVTNLPSNTVGNDPHHWGTVRSSFEVLGRHELDAWIRYVGSLPSPSVPPYASFNARVGVRLPHAMELSVTGFDLLDSSHAEWGVAPNRPEFEPSVFVTLRWQGWHTL